jgi:hypothetical protein
MATKMINSLTGLKKKKKKIPKGLKYMRERRHFILVRRNGCACRYCDAPSHPHFTHDFVNMNRRLDKTDIEGRQKDLSVFFFIICWIDASSREFTADAIFVLFSERCGFFHSAILLRISFFWGAEKERKSMWVCA